MNHTRTFLAVLCLSVIIGCSGEGRKSTERKSAPGESTAQTMGLKPPLVASVHQVTDDYFGNRIIDPYRYMEDLTNAEVKNWFKSQNDYARAVLMRIPGRKELLNRLKELDESAPDKVFDVRRLPDERYFYQKQLRTEEVAKLYMRIGLDGPEKLLVDPTKYQAPNGPHYSINYYQPSFDGSYVVYGASPGGSEDAVIHIVETATCNEANETIDRAEGASPFWLPDGHSFLFERLQKLSQDMPQTEKYLKGRVYLHVVGTDPEKDTPVFGYGLSPAVKMEASDMPIVVTDSGSPEVFGVVCNGVQFEITLYMAAVLSLGKGDVPWQKVCDVEDEVTWFSVHGDDLYLLTHKDAPRFKVVRTRLSHPVLAEAQEILPQGETIIRGTAAAQDALYVQMLDNGIGRLVRVPFDSGRPEQVKLPFEGSINIRLSNFEQAAPTTDAHVPGLLLEMVSWTKARRIYAYDPVTNQTTDTRLQSVGPFDDLADTESEEIKVPSYDGTLVPLSIVHRRGLKLDGSHPTWLRGYGAYGITLEPVVQSFDPGIRVCWLEQGGVYAAAHVRGGGELGEDWHLAGKQLTKPNTWRDFIACAEYLIDRKYTSAARISAAGGSAGGITVGRALTERPDLFAAVIDQVGVSNALRTELSPNGPLNIPEFGSVTTQAGFEDLYAMDSYHYVRDGTGYPAVLLTTGMNDPRVPPWQPGKMAARLQAATSSGKPILLRVEYEGGHGHGSTKTQLQEEMADEMSFALWQFGETGFQPTADSRK